MFKLWQMIWQTCSTFTNKLPVIIYCDVLEMDVNVVVLVHDTNLHHWRMIENLIIAGFVVDYWAKYNKIQDGKRVERLSYVLSLVCLKDCSITGKAEFISRNKSVMMHSQTRFFGGGETALRTVTW